MTDPIRYCACGCGAPVRNKWVRGHAARGEGGPAGRPAGRVDPLPPPDDPVWDDPAGTIDVGELEPDGLEAGSGTAQPAAESELTAGPAAPDPPPAHGRRNWQREAKAGPRPKAVRVTAAVRGDISAKISFALEVPGQVWKARDPLCGGTFVQQRPEIADAVTEIVCQSPDMVAWFAGSGGKFMLWLNLAAACWPVSTMMMAHHVYHSAELGAPEPAQDYAA